MEWRESDGIRWLAAELPGASAAFSTRLGGVSEGSFESLNLGILTADVAEAVRENRRRLSAALAPRAGSGRDRPAGPRRRDRPPRRAAGAGPLGRSGTGSAGGRRARPRRARPRRAGVRRRLPADRPGRRRAAWRSCTEAGAASPPGSSGPASMRSARPAAAIGPGIGPCCFEVGEEVLAAFAPLGRGLAKERMLDLVAVARRLLERAGVAEGSIESADLCTRCNPELFFSHRGQGPDTGRQAGVAWGQRRMIEPFTDLDPDRIREQPRGGPGGRGRRDRDPRRRQVRADRARSRRSRQAGVTLIGENRLDDLAAKRDRYGDRFEWDFIGNLQSRKVRDVVPLVRLIHSVWSDSVLEQLEKHGEAGTEVLIQVNVAGEEGKGGVEVAELAGVLERCPVPVVGLSTMPPFTEDPEELAPVFRPARRARGRARAAAALDGDEPGLARGGRGGGDDAAPRIDPVRLTAAGRGRLRRFIIPAGEPLEGAKRAAMAVRDTWNRALVYFGLAEDPEYRYDDEDDPYEPDTISDDEVPSRRARAAPSRPRPRTSAGCGATTRAASTTSSPTTSRRGGGSATCGRSPRAEPTSRSTSSPRATSTTPRRSPTASSEACR